jgi:hypothetical protein
MLLNLSNHHSTSWSATQTQNAIDAYTTIADVLFPHIPPDADNYALDLIVNEYYAQILNIQPTAVHIMGEMTFVFKLVTLLKQNNIICLASTTKRIASEVNNIKTSYFEFVQFREY